MRLDPCDSVYQQGTSKCGYFCMTNQGLVNIAAAEQLHRKIMNAGESEAEWTTKEQALSLAEQVLVGGFPGRPVTSERQVFQMCGLPYLHPRLRNCA